MSLDRKLKLYILNCFPRCLCTSVYNNRSFFYYRLGLMSHFGALAAAASGRSPFMLYPGVGIASTTASALDKHWYSAWSQPLSAAISPTGKSRNSRCHCLVYGVRISFRRFDKKYWWKIRTHSVLNRCMRLWAYNISYMFYFCYKNKD